MHRTTHHLEHEDPGIIKTKRSFAQLEKKGPLINLVENPEALGFHQETTKDPIEQMKTMEDSMDIAGLVLYQTLFFLFEKITTSFGYNTKIQNTNRYFNVSGNIIK